MSAAPPHVGLLSLECWDHLWRRNQHLAARLVGGGAVGSLVFLTPPRGGLAVRARRHSPLRGIEVVTPPLVIPRSHGGYRVLARWLRHELRRVDLLWINDPVAGVGVLRAGLPAVYDVTDDWREMPQRPGDRARIVAAEDILARRAGTVVCSDVLAERWMRRYGVAATVVRNGADSNAFRDAPPRVLEGRGPHAVYAGTLHGNRFDAALVQDLAVRWHGTVHLVGPDQLEPGARAGLRACGVRLHGSKPATEIPSWLASADVLICPHTVTPFTLSLDAIKSHEYLATDRPVVATPSSGFQALTAPGLSVVPASAFVAAVAQAAGTGPYQRHVAADWAQRADEFAAVLTRTTASP